MVLFDKAVFDLSTEGLQTALKRLFDIHGPKIKSHPNYADLEDDDDTFNRFLRRALVTALAEQNVSISDRMWLWLIPLSIKIFPERIVEITSPAQFQVDRIECTHRSSVNEVGVPRTSFSAKLAASGSKDARGASRRIDCS